MCNEQAFGETRSSTGTTPTDYLYTGQRLEAEIGLYFYNARWHDPVLGRFAQADTIIPGAGNPLALDRYAYVMNNPLRYTDPSGHVPCPPTGPCGSTGSFTNYYALYGVGHYGENYSFPASTPVEIPTPQLTPVPSTQSKTTNSDSPLGADMGSQRAGWGYEAEITLWKSPDWWPFVKYTVEIEPGLNVNPEESVMTVFFDQFSFGDYLELTTEGEYYVKSPPILVPPFMLPGKEHSFGTQFELGFLGFSNNYNSVETSAGVTSVYNRQVWEHVISLESTMRITRQDNYLKGQGAIAFATGLMPFLPEIAAAITAYCTQSGNCAPVPTR